MPAFLTSRPSSASTAASRFWLIVVTTASTGADFSTISPTAAIASSRPLVICRSATIVDTR
jgi:hypothetical protein